MKEQNNLKEIIKFRHEKLENIRNAGHNPYAYNYKKTHHIIARNYGLNNKGH